MTPTEPDWRVVDGLATAWFATTSLTQGAALAGRVLTAVPDADLDLRSTGVQVRVHDDEQAAAVSGAARALRLRSDPLALQRLSVVLEAADPAAVRAFWQPVLGYAAAPDGLADPLRRDPGLRLRPATERPLQRDRFHLDVVRPGAVVAQASPGEPSGPYGVRHADPEGTEIDPVPGDRLGEHADTADWQVVFGAVAVYRVASTSQQHDLAAAAAALADEAGFPLLVDLRPGLVVLDSGKDRWEPDAPGSPVDFPALAASLQAAARDLGAVPDPALPRFVQVFLDAADVAAVRRFWASALGYVPDPRPDVTDVLDPRRLGPVLVLQRLDPAETEGRRQRNFVHVELAVPPDAVRARLRRALGAGGRLLDAQEGRWRVGDPEGNELVLVSG